MTTTTHSKKHGYKSESKALLNVAVPAILAQLAQMSLGVIDTLMAGNYNETALAAIGTGVNSFMIIFSLFLGLMFALNPMVSHYNGQGRFKDIGRVFQLGFFLAVIFGLITFIVLRSVGDLLLAIGVDSDLAQTTDGYLSALSYGTISLYLFIALRSGNEGLFSTKAIMVCSFLAIPFNIIFNYWFIYGGLGIPALGAEGVGYATSLVWTVLCVSLGLFTWKHKPFRNLEIFSHWHMPKLKLVKEYFSIGMPMAIGMLLEISMFGLIGILIARYGVELTGAHQIAMNIASIAFMIPLGLSVAITARAGYWMGKKEYTNVRIVGLSGLGMTLLFQAFSIAAMILFRYEFVGFYSDNTEIIEIAASLIFLAAIFQLSDGLQIASAAVLRGMKDTKIPTVYMAIAYWLVGMPLGYYLAEEHAMQVQGYWIGIIAGLTVAAILLLARFMRKSTLTPSTATIN